MLITLLDDVHFLIAETGGLFWFELKPLITYQALLIEYTKIDN